MGWVLSEEEATKELPYGGLIWWPLMSHCQTFSSDKDMRYWGSVGEKMTCSTCACCSMIWQHSLVWIFHKWIVSSLDTEAIMVESIEMETDKTEFLWPWKVLITPPVCTSQILTVSSSLPDISNVPSSEKVRQNTHLACPENAAAWLPVILSRMVISPDSKPTAIISSQCTTLYGQCWNSYYVTCSYQTTTHMVCAP